MLKKVDQLAKIVCEYKHLRGNYDEDEINKVVKDAVWKICVREPNYEKVVTKTQKVEKAIKDGKRIMFDPGEFE